MLFRSRNTVLVDVVPDGAEFVEASDGGAFADGHVTWMLGDMAAGASKTVAITIQTSRTGILRNTATATAVCADGAAAATTEIQGIPAILLEVVDLDDPIEVGSNVTYEIIVTNQGSAPGTNIAVTCLLANTQAYVSAAGPTQASVEDQVVKFAPLASLAPRDKIGRASCRERV